MPDDPSPLHLQAAAADAAAAAAATAAHAPSAPRATERVFGSGQKPGTVAQPLD